LLLWGLCLLLATIPALALLPALLAGLWMVAWSALLPAALAIAALVGQGKSRVFCMAALFPALMLLVSVSAAVGSVLSSQSGVPHDMGDFLRQLPDRHLGIFLLCWLLVPCAGLVGLWVARIHRPPT
jgi:hypothetical protein